MAEIQESARRLIQAALAAGADEADVQVSEDRELRVTVRMRELETLQESGSRGFSLRVHRGGRRAVVHGTDLAPEVLDRMAREAVDLAAVTEPDDYHRLPEPELYARDRPELDLFDAGERPSTERCIAMARETEAAALDADPRMENCQGSHFGRVDGHVHSVTSNGFEGGYPYSSFSMSVMPVARDAAGDRVTESWGARALHFEDLDAPDVLGRRAAARVLRMCDARSAPTGEAAVLFESESAARMMSLLLQCLSGGAVWRGQSYLADRLGEIVASPLLSLIDDPHLPRGLGSRPFDGEGLTGRRLVIIEKGRLGSFLTDMESARRLKLPATGHGSWGGGVSPSNLFVPEGEISLESMIAATGRGLLVTGYMGTGFEAASGHWSQGVEGLWIEGGEIAYPVKGATIAGGFDQVLAGIDLLGDDRDPSRGALTCPSLRVGAMTVSGG